MAESKLYFWNYLQLISEDLYKNSQRQLSRNAFFGQQLFEKITRTTGNLINGGYRFMLKYHCISSTSVLLL